MSAVKELSEAAEFVAVLANALSEAMADGQMTLGDAAHLMPVLYKLPTALDGLGDVVLADISNDDLALIVKKVKDTLDLPNDKIEFAVEESLEIALKLYSLVQKIRG